MNSYHLREINDRYFIYNEAYYVCRTVVKLKDDYIQNNTFQGKPIWKYAWFYRRVTEGEVNYLFCIARFQSNANTLKEYCGYFTVKENLLDSAIEEIIEPYQVNIIEEEPLYDWEDYRVLVGWIIYILVLFFSFIFTEWYILWAIASWFFFTFRAVALRR